REQVDQYRSERKPRYGITDEDQRRRSVIQGSSMSDRLDDAERNRDRINEERRHQAVIDGNRKPLGDDLQDRLVVAEGLSEIELDGLVQPYSVGHRQRLVEAVVFAQLLQLPVRDRQL